MKIQWKIATILGTATLFCGLYTFGIPAFVNNSLNKTLIENKIQTSSGYRVDIGNPKIKMGAFPSVWVMSDNVSLLNSDNTKAFSVDNPILKIKLFPLLFKKIEIVKVSADNELANFKYTKDNKFYLGDYELTPPKNKTNSKFTLSKLELDIGKYDINLKDEKNNQDVNLTGEYLKNGRYIANKQVDFSIKNVLTIDGKKTPFFADVEILLPINILTEDKFKINAQLENFDLANISKYVNILTNGKIKKTKGIVNLSAVTTPETFNHKKVNINLATKNLEIVGVDKPRSIYFDKNLDLKIKFRTIDNGIKFEDTSLISEKINFALNGKLYNLGNKLPSYDVTAEVKDTRTENVIALIPGIESLLPDFNLYKLKKYIFYADANGKLTFKGSGAKPNVKGNVHISNAYLIKPIQNAPANADIKLNFIGQKMLLDVFVPTEKTQYVKVNGKVKIDGSKYSELNITSTDSVNLGPAQVVLNPLHEILKFQLGPVPMMKISGRGNISLHSAGRKVDPHIWGNISFRDVVTSFTDVHNLVLYNGAGEVNFNDTLVTFKNSKGTINGKDVDIHGDCKVLDKLNVYVNSKNQEIVPLLKAVNSSPILIDVQKVVKPFTKPQGMADIALHIYGNVTNAEMAVFGKDIFSKGTITLHNAQTVIQDTFLPFVNVNGVVNFDKYDSDYDITGNVRNSKVHVKGTGSNSNIDLKAYSDNFALNDIFDMLHPNMLLPYKNEIGTLKTSFVGSYKGMATNGAIDYNNVVVDGKFLPNMNTKDTIKLNDGTFTMKQGVLKTSLLNGLFNNNPFNLSLTANNLDKEYFNILESKFHFEDFNLNTISSIKKQIKLPKEYQAQLNNIDDFNGYIDIDGSIKNNIINAKTNLKNTSFIYKPLSAIVKIVSGNVNIYNNTLYLDKINSHVNSMPMFVNGKIANILSKNPYMNVLVTTKLNQQFCDKVFNTKSVYPIKIKGDVNLRSNLSGKLDAIHAKTALNIAENSSIYYMGATLSGVPKGTISDDTMTTNPVSIISDAILYPNKIKLNSLDYNQILVSQNKKQYLQNQLQASGTISLLKNNVLAFDNFRVKTNEPTDAKIFNILFKKPTIQQGVFDADILLNGTSNLPKAIGNLNLKSVDIPLYDATIQDVAFNFDKNYVDLLVRGIVLTNDILIKSKIVNKATLPIQVEDLDIYTDSLNLNVIASSLDDFDADYIRNKRNSANGAIILPADNVIIKNSTINADKVIIKKANATNFKSHLSLNENSELDIDKFNFNIADGVVNGNIKYDLKTYKGTGQMGIKNANAEIIAENFFDMPGQMYGTVTGDMDMSCTGISSVDCINTLSGEGSFKVSDGKMPKLGSLEYLLKAGNLITSGLTGVSINGIIDLITPLKTGSFKTISGTVHVKDGIADDINVYSSGTDLNMYMTGSYNIASLVADMEIYGSLSKNFQTLLGKIGNSSLNTLFNTIPGININEISPKSTSNIYKIPNFDKTNVLRVFKAEIYGDINGSNYVKSFKWIKH